MPQPNWQGNLATLWKICGALNGTGVKQMFHHRFWRISAGL
jgi:hypothetical protein